MMMQMMMQQKQKQMKPCRAFRCRSLEKGFKGLSEALQGARAFRLEALDDAEADARAFLKALDDDDEALQGFQGLHIILYIYMHVIDTL